MPHFYENISQNGYLLTKFNHMIYVIPLNFLTRGKSKMIIQTEI